MVIGLSLDGPYLARRNPVSTRQRQISVRLDLFYQEHIYCIFCQTVLVHAPSAYKALHTITYGQKMCNDLDFTCETV